ncbi:MAG: hypothetical protein HFI76_11185 [Lachnospiraceae bacterium]|jgi:hypothetical protein|nr:hypothetical protein [Lachnospiraceae bacterium]
MAVHYKMAYCVSFEKTYERKRVGALEDRSCPQPFSCTFQHVKGDSFGKRNETRIFRRKL